MRMVVPVFLFGVPLFVWIWILIMTTLISSVLYTAVTVASLRRHLHALQTAMHLLVNDVAALRAKEKP
jgi:hypothetical protein